MPCALTQSLTLDCRDSIGGLKSVMFIEFANVTAITAASGIVTAITKAAGKKFYKYELAKETSQFTETFTSSVANGTFFYAQELSIVLNKLQTNVRNEILLLAQNNLLAIAEDKNGSYWLLGRLNGLDVTGGNAASGTANGDRSGYTITLTAQEKELAISVNSGIIAALLA
jgi:hypothetical protein